MSARSRATIYALSTVAMAFTAAACKPGATGGVRSASASPAQRSASIGDTAAKKAREALDQGNPSGAISFAEASVAFQPDNAGRRQLLAEAYLKAGRFVSAEQAWGEVLQLQPANVKAMTALALSQIAAGDAATAKRTLADAQGKMPADDLGLAFALSGDTDQAIHVLEPVALGTSGTARARQNLALAYALSGRWAAARSLAARDLDAATLDQRMESWARLASAPATVIRVASMLNVIPDPTDSGRPQALALAAPLPAAPMLAAAAVPVQETKVAMLEVPAPQLIAARQAPPPPMIVAPPAPILSEAIPAAPQFAAIPANIEIRPIQPKLARFDLAMINVATPEPARQLAVAAPVKTIPQRTLALTRSTQLSFPQTKPVLGNSGGFVVQLGAYRGADRMTAGWQQVSLRVKPLARYNPVASLRFSPTRGLSFYRLAVGGFPTRAAAQRLCAEVQKSGGQCFVRGADREAPIRMVLRDADVRA